MQTIIHYMELIQAVPNTSAFKTEMDDNLTPMLLGPPEIAKVVLNLDLESRGIVLPSENKGTDQHRSYCAADLRLCFPYARNSFSLNAAKIDWQL